MATLAESFLADLDDLSDASDREDEVPQEEEDTKVQPDFQNPMLALLRLLSFCI